MRQLVFLFIVVAVVCIVVPNNAQAQVFDGYCGGSMYGYGSLYQNLDYKIPYFAAYPPVYYSYIVARPYGYSPFAYPPGTRTPEIAPEPIHPETVINPYVEQPANDTDSRQDAAQESDDKVTAAPRSAPLVILNPFVSQRFPLVQAAN